MAQPRYYGAAHPMVSGRTGDPARGEWIPKSKRVKKRKPRK